MNVSVFVIPNPNSRMIGRRTCIPPPVVNFVSRLSIKPSSNMGIVLVKKKSNRRFIGTQTSPSMKNEKKRKNYKSVVLTQDKRFVDVTKRRH